MFFIFSKLFNLFTSPINWIVGLLVISLLSTVKKRRLCYIGLSIFLLLFFTNNQLYVLAVNGWSKSYHQQPIPTQVFEIAIVAGGAVSYSQNWQQVDYNEQSDRITESIRLYRQGRIKKLYLSGESAFNVKQGTTYAPHFLDYMEDMGINRQDIILEQHARTTRENVLNLKKLLVGLNPDTPILVITSGWHMRRLLKGFEGSGLNLVPYAVDVSSLHPIQEWQDFLPTWKAAQNWQKLIHEIIGLLII